MTIRERYMELNRSFKPMLICHTGIDAGFFTEYTYMISAMLYCLQHRIRFVLYSADANFGYRNGWTDYFLPFCDEVADNFHHRYNLHPQPSWGRVMCHSLKNRTFTLVRWKIKATGLCMIGNLRCRKLYGKQASLTHSIRFDPGRHFHIPELGIDGNYMHAFNILTEVVWKFQPAIRKEIELLTAQLHLPERYAGCQVRGGDKITEVDLLPPDFYASLIEERRSERDVFVLTDEYKLFEQLRLHSPSIRWYTLCQPDEQGYVNSQFSQVRGEAKRQAMIRFLTSIDILSKSSVFIGSITPGPSLFLLKRLYPHVIPVDCRPDQVAEASILRIADRRKMAEQFLARQ